MLDLLFSKLKSLTKIKITLKTIFMIGQFFSLRSPGIGSCFFFGLRCLIVLKLLTRV